MKGKLSCNIKCLILSLLVIAGVNNTLFSQSNFSKISGKINKYGRVTSVGADYVNVDNESQFHQFSPGDTVLLIQMKGARIYSQEGGSFGTAYYSYGQAGMHEFLIILSVDDLTNKIIFTSFLKYPTFDVAAFVQIIKVPSYNNALVNGTLTCEPWDSTTKTGGVLTAIVGKTLSLNANIDVTGNGLIGGTTAVGQGICIITNAAKYDQYAFPASSDSAGFKGEGVAIRGDTGTTTYPPLYPLFAKGKGRNFNGGGGGNGKFSGGGGGANYGTGGTGGKEINSCVPNYSGGLGGNTITGTGLEGGLFLGGGGGASTHKGIGVSTPGANGGGMIILICDTLKGNGNKILAEGATPSVSASGNAGAGGGGGGGSIAIYLQSYSSNLTTSAITISANGSKGGDNLGQQFGEGGGGGGGYIITNNVTDPGNVFKWVFGGAVGIRSGASTGSNGGTGRSLTTFVPVLRGFLFNSIRSSITGDQIDSICSNVVPKPITGTYPVGGTGPYSYKWQKSYNLSGLWADISGETLKDYTPVATEVNTFWVRRIVKDNGTLLTDTSKYVQIIVQPAITGNLVGKDTTICYGQNPLPLIPLNTGPSNGNGHYVYQWLSNTDNVTWTNNASGASTLASYDPSALTVDTYYKRKVTSGRCVDNSVTVTITVLPLITGNVTTRPDSVICEGLVFNNVEASAAVGGSGAYVYLWQDSTSSSTWLPAAGTNSNTIYSADTSKFAVIEDRFYRRVVFSGPDNVCKSNSVPIHLTRYHKIKTNSISADQTICSGFVPVALTGSTPTQGNLIYTYQWQDSSKSVPIWTTRGTAKTPYSPAALTDTTWYRRIVNSSKCTNASTKIVINVHRPIVNNFAKLISGPGPDTTICSGGIPNKIIGTVPAGGTDIPGSYAYQWSSSPDNVTFTDITTSGTLQDYQPGPLAATTYFRRRTISGMCSSQSNSIRVIVLLPITNNLIAVSKPAICFGTVPNTITGTALTGGAGGTPIWIWQQSTDGITWIGATGTANQQNYAPPALMVKTWYKRIIMSGLCDCCIDTSNVVTIDINPLPTGANAGADSSIISFDYMTQVSASPIQSYESGKWSVVAGTGDFENDAATTTYVKNISIGTDTYRWTVTNGECILTDDVTYEVSNPVIPEGISPDGDLINDTLRIDGLDFVNQIVELSILNGAGTLVFSSSNKNGEKWISWDGKNLKGKELPEGTYYYLLKVTSPKAGHVAKKSGFIILKRQ